MVDDRTLLDGPSAKGFGKVRILLAEVKKNRAAFAELKLSIHEKWDVSKGIQLAILLGTGLKGGEVHGNKFEVDATNSQKSENCPHWLASFIAV